MILSGSSRNARVSVTHYSAEEVIRQFLALYNCMDFKAEFEDIGIGRFQFLLRNKALREFRALCIAFWGLALSKSFPDDAEKFFEEFRNTAPMFAEGGKEASLLQSRVNSYISLLTTKRDSDFLPLADYLAGELGLNVRDVPRARLKLSLVLRNLYMLIFNKLV